jgi:FHS family L-fucose permease-like MFS transporter
MNISTPGKLEVSNEAGHGHTLFPAGQLVPFILVTVLFFLWGIPNNLNDVLIRQFMKSFAITRFQAGLVQSAFYMGYFLLAMPAALLMRKAGYKTGFVIGLFLFGTGCFLFWPAALAGSYGFFLFALFVIASGLSFLETASNPFIAQLGDPDTSERRLNFSQAFNPFGAITGALIGTVFIFSGVELTPRTDTVLLK